MNLFFKLLVCLSPLLLTGCAAGLLLTEAEVAFLGSSGVRVMATTAVRGTMVRTAVGAAARTLVVADEGLLAARASRLFVKRQGAKTFLRAAVNGSTENVAEVLSKRRFRTIKSQQVIDLPGDLYFVITGELNVRSGPGTENAVVATIKEGRPVAVESEEKGWYKVWVNDEIQGWVLGKFVKALSFSSDSDKDPSTGMQSKPAKEVIKPSVKVEEPYNPYGIGHGQILFYCSSTFSDASKDWSIYVDDVFVGNLNGVAHSISLNCQNEGTGIVKQALKAGSHAVQLKDALGNYRKGTLVVDVAACKPFDCIQLNTEVRTIQIPVETQTNKQNQDAVEALLSAPAPVAKDEPTYRPTYGRNPTDEVPYNEYPATSDHRRRVQVISRPAPIYNSGVQFRVQWGAGTSRSRTYSPPARVTAPVQRGIYSPR